MTGTAVGKRSIGAAMEFRILGVVLPGGGQPVGCGGQRPGKGGYRCELNADADGDGSS